MSKVIIKRYSVIFYGIVFLFLIKNFRKIKNEFQTNRQTSLGKTKDKILVIIKSIKMRSYKKCFKIGFEKIFFLIIFFIAIFDAKATVF